MDQQKIGAFLRQLRRERCLTQEQLAELVNVSNRSVSRWETGTNLPDLDILIQLADFYEVSLRELLDGSRFPQHESPSLADAVQKEVNVTVRNLADYTRDEKEQLTRMLTRFFAVGLMMGFVNAIFSVFQDEILSAGMPCSLFRFCHGFSSGVMTGVMILGLLFSTGHLGRFRAAKQRMLRLNRNPATPSGPSKQ